MECIDWVTVALLMFGLGAFLLVLLTTMELVIGLLIKIWRSRSNLATRICGNRRLRSGSTLGKDFAASDFLDKLEQTEPHQTYDLDLSNVEVASIEQTDATSGGSTGGIGRAA